jgi:hypothetical protein
MQQQREAIPIYYDLNQFSLDEPLDLIKALRGELQPTPDHPDPEAINDCWQSLYEQVKVMKERLEFLQRIEERLATTSDFTAAELGTVDSKLSPAAYLLTKGKLNGLQFVRTFFVEDPFASVPDKIMLLGIRKTRDVFINGERLDPGPSLAIAKHSPDGFNWGYAGSGPAQLALAILLKYLKPHIARQHYQSFKFEIITKLPQDDFNKEIHLRKALYAIAHKDQE